MILLLSVESIPKSRGKEKKKKRRETVYSLDSSAYPGTILSSANVVHMHNTACSTGTISQVILNRLIHMCTL